MSTTPTRFPKSGVSRAKVNDTYTNTTTGHVYQCTSIGSPTYSYYKTPDTKVVPGRIYFTRARNQQGQWVYSAVTTPKKDELKTYFERSLVSPAGTPAKALWRYVRTDIVKKPGGKVSSLASPVRGSGLVFEATWKVPASLTDTSKGDRATKLEVKRRLSVSVTKSVKAANGKSKLVKYTDDYDNAYTTGTSTRSATVNVNSFKSGKKTYTRSSFYPLTDEKLTAVKVYVRAVNGKGDGEWVGESRKIGAPEKPTVATPTVDTGTWRVSCEITPAPDTAAKERYRTRYQVRVFRSATNEWKTVQDGSTTTDDAFTRSYDVTDAQIAGRFTRVQFRAMSQGLAGDSDWTSWKEHVVGWPAKPTISKVEIKSTDATAYGTAKIATNASATAPVDGVRLQALVPGENDDDITTPEAATASADWEDVDGALDNGKCKALAFLIGEVTPPRGKHAWIRVKAWNDSEATFAAYSDPKRLDKLFVAAPPDPTAADDTCAIISCEKGADGRSAQVRFAWARSGRADDSDETEVSWSTREDAWDSTDDPKSYMVANSRGKSGNVPYGSVTYTKSYILTICDLDEGEQVFVRCRRHMKSNDTFGPYSNTGKCIPSIAPSGVVLSAPSHIAAGQGVTIVWGYAGGGTQRGWKLKTAGGKVIASGTDSMAACTVPWATVATHASNGVLSCRVEVSTGGDYVASGIAQTAIVEPPVLGFGAIQTVTAQPLAVPLACDKATAEVAVTVIAQGISGAAPYGDDVQAEGDTVWSDMLIPVWALDPQSGVYTATVAAPPGLALKDGGSYTVEAVATDTVTGLRSAAATATVSVAWARQAPVPADGVQIVPSVTTDADGAVARKCAITLAAPESAAETDVYDLYRMTGDGAQLIGADLALDAQVEDRYAPFGDATMRYRVALRTVDGDVEWRDYEYDLEGEVIRFDFDGDEHGYVEIKTDIGAVEAFAKDFEASKAMDGTQAGGWAPGVAHTASYKGSVIRLEAQDVIDAVRDLARTPKPVFVRTGFGTAFAANVDVDMLDLTSMGGSGVACSFKARAIDLTDDFMLPTPDDDEEEEETEGGGQ